VIQKNFPSDLHSIYLNDRMFKKLQFSDQYNSKHYLPLFLSKITPPDSNVIEFDEMGIRRGIRTLGEVAHFVRSIPYKTHEKQDIWSSPDFLLTIRVGTIDEHALLMASMFRAIKYETTKELQSSKEYKKNYDIYKARIDKKTKKKKGKAAEVGLIINDEEEP
jgi:hypothetical protein